MINSQGKGHLTITEQAKAVFEDLKRVKDGSEYWSARELMPALGYRSWQKFEGVIDRAQVACFNSGFEPSNHFIGSGKMVETGSGAKREVVDYRFSRYACYLVAQNGDPRKPAIAAAQSYFAIKTREAETVIPAQKQELEKLKLELALSQSRERLAGATQMLALINPGLPALAFGKPDAVVEIERPVTVVTDAYGHTQRYDGFSITQLAQRWGFGKGKKANDRCRAWIQSRAIGEQDWIEEPSIYNTKKLPPAIVRRLDADFQTGKGDRQKLLGEQG